MGLATACEGLHSTVGTRGQQHRGAGGGPWVPVLLPWPRGGSQGGRRWASWCSGQVESQHGARLRGRLGVMEGVVQGRQAACLVCRPGACARARWGSVVTNSFLAGTLPVPQPQPVSTPVRSMGISVLDLVVTLMSGKKVVACWSWGLRPSICTSWAPRCGLGSVPCGSVLGAPGKCV